MSGIRLFTTSARALNSQSAGPIKAAADAVKKVAQAFKTDGAIGQKFTPEGSIGSTADKVGGPFSKDGAIGKEFRESGAIGGTGEKVAEKAEQYGKDVKRHPDELKAGAERTVNRAETAAMRGAQDAQIGAKRTVEDANDKTKELGRKL